MYRHILVPLDGSPTSGRAVQEAIGLAGEQGAQVEFLHVMEEILFLENEAYINYTEVRKSVRLEGEKILSQARSAAEHAGVKAEQKLLDADGARIASVIIGEAQRWPADLIVIGTHGRSGFRRILFGSVAEGVIRGAQVPVLLIRGS